MGVFGVWQLSCSRFPEVHEVDLLSGAAFALQGRMLKVAHLSYLLAPENVEVIEEDVYAASRMRYR